MYFFLEGLVIGLTIAAPVGPIGVLCIQRSLHSGFKVGFVTGIGAACADGVYGLIAAFSITAITSLLMTYQLWIRFIGGLFLIYLGIKTLMASHHYRANSGKTEKSLWRAYSNTFFLTLTNPSTIISFLAIFAGVGVSDTQNNYTHASLIVLGILMGSALWWLFLSGGVSFVLHKRLNSRLLRTINWISGAILLGFGLFAINVLNLKPLSP